MAKLVCQLENVYLFQLALVGLSNFDQQNSKRIGLARLVDHWQQKLTTYTCRLQSADIQGVCQVATPIRTDQSDPTNQRAVFG